MTSIIFDKCGFDRIKAEISRAALVVTDKNIAGLYGDLCDGAFLIPCGEQGKSPETLLAILKEMHARGLRRNDCVVALGGGAVGDVTGLAAALYMRGINFSVVPTTLTAIVDSGLGGKTAVDFCGVKNLVGAFHEPVRMVVSLEFLKTLPDRDYIGGCGECIKTCLLTQNAYRLLRDRFDALIARETDGLSELIDACIAIKNTVATDDLKDRGVRRILNVGHTVGHALESVNGFKASHGEYVLMGLMTECAMFKEYIDRDFYAEIVGTCKRLVSPPRTSVKPVLSLASADKKNANGWITVMLPVSAGNILELRVDRDLFSERYERATAELRSGR